MSTPKESLAQRMAKAVLRVVKESPHHTFTVDEKFTEIVKTLSKNDEDFEQKGGVFFATGSDAFETAERFTQIHVEEYRKNGRPSLPALAVYHAEKLGVDKNTPEYRALILIAMRAEMTKVLSPEYHNKFHYMDVAAMVANLLEKNHELLGINQANLIPNKNCDPKNYTPISSKDEILTLITAFLHDLDHKGIGNPADKPLLNEDNAFSQALPLLHAAGLSSEDCSKIHVMQSTTSPNGPHAILKAIASAHRKGEKIDFSKLDPDNKFPALKVLVDDPVLTQMAAMLSDADLYASAGAGLKANKVMSKLLTKEVQKSGLTMDFNNDAARKYFLDNIVGQEGFASTVGRLVANKTFEKMRSENEERLNKAPKPKGP